LDASEFNDGFSISPKSVVVTGVYVAAFLILVLPLGEQPAHDPRS